MSLQDQVFRARNAGTRPALGVSREVICKRDSQHDLIVFVLRGQLELRDVTAGLEASLDLGLAEYALWNLVQGDLRGLSLVELSGIAARVFAGPWSPRKWAIWAGTGASLAAAVVLADAAEDTGCGERVRAFVDRETALEWLGIRELPTTPAPPDETLLQR